MRLVNRLPRLIRWILAITLVLLLLMSLYRFLFFFQYRGAARPFSGSAFLLGLRYDARVVAAIGLAMLLLCSIPWLHPFKNRKAGPWWVFVLTLVFVIILVFYGADFYHYDYLHQRLNASVLNFLEDAAISAGMVWQTYPVLKIVLVLAVAVVLFAWWQRTLIKKLWDLKPVGSAMPKSRFNTWSHIVIGIVLGGLIFGKLNQYPLRWSDAFAFTDDFKANTALNPFQSFFSTMKFRKSGYDLKKVKAYYPLMADYLQVQRPDSASLNYERRFTFSDTANRPNIVLVICESFSAYKSSMFGNKLDPTPFFNSMCREGVFFERCFTPAFGTARGVWAVITGTPDVEGAKTSSRNPSAVDQHSIINDFTTYNKFYFLGGSTTWANIRGVLSNNISNLRIYEEEHFKAAKVDVWGISDKNLFLESNKILAAQDKPFFAIIQTADNHRPYTIPAEDLGEFKKLIYAEDTLRKYGFDDNGQYNAFRYTDFTFRKFMEAAKQEKYFNNTIFVFVGDHGLRGDAGDMFPRSFTKQGILAEHVPLLFYAPGMLKPASVLNVCSQLDILPSVATLARQPYRNNTFGRNLFNHSDSAERYAFIADPDLATIGLVSNDYYYVKSHKNGEKEFVSVKNNDAVPADSATQAKKAYMEQLTEAWYETAKYMLLNNKKKIGTGSALVN